MINFGELPGEISSAFSILPAPTNIIRDSQYFTPETDIAKSLQESIAGKRWDVLSLHDWAMVGTNPGVARYYLTGTAFHYYIPSILTCVYRTGQYPEFATDSLVPPNLKEKAVQDELKIWWESFVRCFTVPERRCVSVFVRYLISRSDMYTFEIEDLERAWA